MTAHPQPAPRYSSTFIFEMRDANDEFELIDGEIAERARRIPGFLGEEAWSNPATGLHAEVYYWSSMEALRELVGMDTHRLAKSRNQEWLGGYRVVISAVLSVYGDPGLGIEHAPAQGPYTEAGTGSDAPDPDGPGSAGSTAADRAEPGTDATGAAR